MSYESGMRVEMDWQKSSFSEQGDNCLELAASSGAVLLRESDEPDFVIAAPVRGVGGLLASLKAAGSVALPY
ncbi:DUF397 domain-containing protein [Streptomyces orinoci]|uniref:DUF397 domain-containing protein n=1 Tax=Streptomyces orinoci TaxID=67339 RepID=A0ABV3K1D4_STRON|nr:DUF397 domain-containing protein [Streptomyces orinoci]